MNTHEMLGIGGWGKYNSKKTQSQSFLQTQNLVLTWETPLPNTLEEREKAGQEHKPESRERPQLIGGHTPSGVYSLSTGPFDQV